MEPVGSGMDPTGQVYYDGRNYIRHINPAQSSTVREMFSSGLIASLVAHGFCPEFVEEDSDLQFPDHFAGSHIVRSPELKSAVAPQEWSLLMIKDAALTFLEIVRIADQHGFTLRDAHIYNFVFSGNRPVWIDIGSFCKKQNRIPHPWFKEFFRLYLLPLEICGLYPSIAHQIAIASIHLRFKESVRFLLSACRNNILFARTYANWRAQLLSIDNYAGRGVLHNAVKAVLRKNTPKRIDWLRKKILPLQCRSTSWKSYHDSCLVDGKIPESLTPRFERIISLLASVNPQSVLELAGNAGVLSETIARRMPHVPVICTDYDHGAIDSLHSRQKNHPVSNLSYAILDFMNTKARRREQHPSNRFRSDCVLALAVTHHLSLTQRFTFDEIFDEIRHYSSNAVFIEFMPLGLYSGEHSPEIPAWYSEENFRAAFERFFTLNHVEVLEKNRTLFCGTIPAE